MTNKQLLELLQLLEGDLYEVYGKPDDEAPLRRAMNKVNEALGEMRLRVKSVA